MNRLSRIKRHSLPIQMVITLVGLVVLTAAAIGLPAIGLIREQVSRRAQEILDQGSRTAQVLLKTEQTELSNLALLTAQRPTLQRLAQGSSRREMEEYLLTLQRGAGLDLVLLCSTQQQPLQWVGENLGAEACSPAAGNRLFLSPTDPISSAWLLTASPLGGDPSGIQVVVGRALNTDFARRLRDQTGMEVILSLGDQYLTSSFPNGPEIRQVFETLASSRSIAGPESGRPVSVNNVQFLSTHALATGDELELWLFFPATEITTTQQELTWLAIGGIFLVVLFSSGLGILRARQISRPLQRLQVAAVRLRKGDLTTPVMVRTKIYEVAQMAHALEEARSTLLHSLMQLRQEKAWDEHLLESIVEGILTFDRRGRITYFSAGAERITGWKCDQVLGRTIDEVFQTPDGNARFSKRLPESGGRQKVVVLLGDGRRVTLAMTGAQLAPPEVGKASTVLVLRDVSDEEAIRELLGEFLANIAHEFRTPLSALAASIELLQDQLTELNPDELRELLGSTHLGILNLETLIDNLLEGANIETGHFRVYPRPCDPAEIIREAAHTMTPLASKYQQEIQVDLPPQLPMAALDPRRVGQVLVNLISNAVKWSPTNGIIHISAREEDGHICIRVSDQGPGVPEELQADLFRRFDRAQVKAPRAEYGAGLGLSVVKEIVKAHGGSVGVSNQAEGGAAFWFTLPVLTAETSTGQPTAEPAEGPVDEGEQA